MDTVEPFWCEKLGRFLKVIPNEEADRICKDVQLYYKFLRSAWAEDIEPWAYRSGEFAPPSEFWHVQYAIEVHLDKPEYEPEQRSCDHDEL